MLVTRVASPWRIKTCSALTASIEAKITRNAIAATNCQLQRTGKPSTASASGASTAAEAERLAQQARHHGGAGLRGGRGPARPPQGNHRREAQEAEAKAQGEEGEGRRQLQPDLGRDGARGPHRHEIPGEQRRSKWPQ